MGLQINRPLFFRFCQLLVRISSATSLRPTVDAAGPNLAGFYEVHLRAVVVTALRTGAHGGGAMLKTATPLPSTAARAGRVLAHRLDALICLAALLLLALVWGVTLGVAQPERTVASEWVNPPNAQLARHYLGFAAALSLLLLAGAGMWIALIRQQRRHAVDVAAGESRLRASRQWFLEQQGALAELARGELLAEGEVQAFYQKITETVVAVMRVARASIWRFDGGGTLLCCRDLYEAATGTHGAGAQISVADYPAYFAALERHEIIDAGDAHADARTREFSAPYLTPLGITATLDIPLFVSGKLGGVICCEHFGAPLQWTSEHKLFGTALTILVEIAEAHAARRAVLAALEKSERIYRQTFNSTPLPMWVRDQESLAFLDVNDAAIAAYGYSRAAFLSMKAPDILYSDDFPQLAHLMREEAEQPECTHALHTQHRRHDGKIIDVEVITHDFNHGGRRARLVLANDISGRKVLEAQRQAREREQRRIFVRETHHRIKNHVQGVTGLLLGHARREPALAVPIAAAVAQLQSVVVVHGLQGGDERGVRLDEMTEAICVAARSFAAGRVEIGFRCAVQALLIDSDEAVPLALIVNELLMNAVKHTNAVAGGPLVSVELDPAEAGAGARVRISNPGRLPQGFDAACAGVAGRGLGIVRALLPAQGAAFAMVQLGARVCATLELRAPVVRSDAQARVPGYGGTPAPAKRMVTV